MEEEEEGRWKVGKEEEGNSKGIKDKGFVECF